MFIRKVSVFLYATFHTQVRYKTLLMKILTILFSLTLTVGYSQKQYDFDYIMAYDTKFYKDSVKNKKRRYRNYKQNTTRYYMINSKQNKYFAAISEKDSLKYRLMINDFEGKIHSNAEVLKSDLNEAEFIDMNCRNVFKLMNPLKVEDYDFIQLKDPG